MSDADGDATDDEEEEGVGTVPNKKMKKDIKPTYANALSLANTLKITSMTTYSTTPILERSIMQRVDLSNEQKAELLFEQVKGLPCWLTDSVTSDLMIIIIMVRRSPYIIYLVLWQIIRSCLLILHLVSIGRIRTLYRIESVIYANEISRKDELTSDAVDLLVKTVAIHKHEPMKIVIPRIITFGMDANGFEVLILLLKMMNKQLSIEVADDFGMSLVDMAKAYQVRCTEPLTFLNSSHVRPFLSLTNSPEQDEIFRIASSKIQTWMKDEISHDDKQRIIDGCQFGSETKDIDKRELHRKVLSIIRELKEIPLDDMNQYLEMAKKLVKLELGELLSRSNEKTHNVIVVRSSSPLTVATTRRLQFDITDTEDNDEDDEDYDEEEEEDVDEELLSEDLGLPIDINLPMQQLARTIAALERIDMDTKRPLCILGGKCENRRQVSGVYLELIYDLINGHVMHLCTDQTTRISNGLPKFAIVMALCYFRGINLAIASQIDIPPMSIAVADQKRVSVQRILRTQMTILNCSNW
jgi:hypothetical protein